MERRVTEQGRQVSATAEDLTDGTAADAGRVPQARTGGRFLVLLALLLALSTGAALVYVTYEALAREQALRAQLSALAAAPAGQQARLETLTQALAELQQDTPALQERIGRLEAAAPVLAELQQGAPALQQRISRLELAEPAMREAQSEAAATQRERYLELEQRLARAVERTEQQIADRDERIARLEAALRNQRVELSALSTLDRSDWQLAEAVYLLRLAQQRLTIARDLPTAQALLANADGILMDLDDLALQPLREAVARDLAALRAVPRVDVPGLYARLSAVAAEIDALVLVRQQRLDAQQRVVWRERLGAGVEAAFARLSEYLVVRRRAVPVEPLMDPQWEGLVRQNLRLLTEQAQLALLGGEQALYTETLERAQGWLAQLVDVDATAVVALREEMRALAAESVSPPLPGGLTALRAAEAALARRTSASG